MKDHEPTPPRSATEDRAFASLDARLRVLRARYRTLSVLTEIAHLSERLVAIRATLSIDGQIRAHGHAATAADRSGAFVAEAELLAVRQALLLGGLLADEAVPAAHGDDPARETTNATEPGEVTAQAQPPPAPPSVPDPAPRPQRQRATGGARRAVEAQPASVAADMPPESPPSPDPVVDLGVAEHVAAAADEPERAPSAGTTRDTVADAAPALSQPAEPEPTPALAQRPKRERPRTRAATTPPASDAAAETAATEAPQVTVVSAVETADPVIETDVPVVTDALAAVQGQLIDAGPSPTVPPTAPRPAPATRRPATVAEPSPPIAPHSTRSAATRRPRAVASAPATSPPASDAPPTREQIRAAWTHDRPIPAWWPPVRPLTPKRVTKAQAERLRVVALDEEITPALLDTYSTMLFGRAVAELDQTEYAILEERLDRTYPSPLEETRARRLLFPIAVADTMPIPPDHPVFVHWRDVPPVVAEEPRQPTVPSWRTRGTRAGGRRR